MKCLSLLALLLTLTSCQNPSRPLPLDSLVDRSFIEDGGLTSYGANLIGLYRRVASYVDRIFKGEKPTNVPVMQLTKFELVSNLQLDPAAGWARNTRRLRADGLFQCAFGSELGRQVAVDFESDADFHKCGSCPVHSFLSLRFIMASNLS